MELSYKLTETITFRLDKDTLDKIRNVAKREKTSLNGLVNNIELILGG